jgi:hypothetical protein
MLISEFENDQNIKVVDFFLSFQNIFDHLNIILYEYDMIKIVSSA